MIILIVGIVQNSLISSINHMTTHTHTHTKSTYTQTQVTSVSASPHCWICADRTNFSRNISRYIVNPSRNGRTWEEKDDSTSWTSSTKIPREKRTSSSHFTLPALSITHTQTHTDTSSRTLSSSRDSFSIKKHCMRIILVFWKEACGQISSCLPKPWARPSWCRSWNTKCTRLGTSPWFTSYPRWYRTHSSTFKPILKFVTNVSRREIVVKSPLYVVTHFNTMKPIRMVEHQPTGTFGLLETSAS